jgi:cyclophilin family peptidyl-prolyl cis-trans isomerase/HEAT repeat protein
MRPASFSLLLCAVCLAASACATTAEPPPPEPPVVTWEDKAGWMMRLEDQRIIRDPNPPPQVIIAPATQLRPAVVAPPPPSDLIRLLRDGEARVRRRAALALGRVGLPEAVEPLAMLLADEDVEVRQMAAFALGLIGDASARPPLLAALRDTSPIVAGRAAEALGHIANRDDASAVSDMVRTYAAAGALTGITADELAYPLAPQVEAIRLGLYALVRLGSFDALWAAAIGANGQPISNWWPVAYALQRLGDARAAPALIGLLNTPGRYTAAFAARGLGVMKAPAATAPLRQIVEQRNAPAAVQIQALRALAAIGDRASVPALTKLVADARTDPALRAEAMNTLATAAGPESTDLMLDLISDPSPVIRAGAIRILGRLDPEALLVTLSGLDPDRDWSVRAAQATALAALPGQQGVQPLMGMLGERDQRVLPALMTAMVTARAPGVEKMLIQRLGEDDFTIRAAAAAALGELKSKEAVPALVQAYRAAVGDSVYTARAAFLGALNQIDPAAARPLLQEALRDREWPLRIRAAELLRAQGAPQPPETIRPASGGPAIDEVAFRSLVSPRFSPHAFIETDRGVIEIELAILDAPRTVWNFITLARKGFFDGVAIHRVVPDFVVQDGDPRGDGEGSPGYTIRDEINERPYLRGTVGMALDWEDTGGSQFFITHSPQPHLDGRYTVFGHVVEGMDVVDRIVQGDVIRSVRINDGTQ